MIRVMLSTAHSLQALQALGPLGSSGFCSDALSAKFADTYNTLYLAVLSILMRASLRQIQQLLHAPQCTRLITCCMCFKWQMLLKILCTWM